MGTSFLEYNDIGVWVRDASLILFLAWMCDSAEERSGKEPWLESVAETWREALSQAAPGCVPTYLNKIIASEEHKPLLKQVAVTVTDKLRKHGDSVPLSFIHETARRYKKEIEDRVLWFAPLPSQPLIELGEMLIRIIDGDETVHDPTCARGAYG
jgi:hypothetical protein